MQEVVSTSPDTAECTVCKEVATVCCNRMYKSVRGPGGSVSVIHEDPKCTKCCDHFGIPEITDENV